MNKVVAALSVIIILSGCASHYFLDGTKYESEEAFQSAVEERRSSELAKITPLPSPLTDKRLIVAIPSEQTFYAVFLERHHKLNGSEARGLALDQYRNLAKSNFKLTKVLLEGVQKRGIYQSVTINETPSAVNSLEPSNAYDVLFFTESGMGSGQYFYASAKHGKQVFAFDQSSNDKVNAFIEAVQALAIRE